MTPFACFRCGAPGHLAADCPELAPATTRAEHEARIAEYRKRMDNWLDGGPGIRWNPEMKTQAIKHENAMWKATQKEPAK